MAAIMVLAFALAQWEMPGTGVTGAAPAPAPPPICPGTGEKRVWYACMGVEFEPPTDDEIVAGVTRGNQVCCTPEYDFACLCCIDFTAQMDLSRCGTMDLESANQPAGSPLAMLNDASDAMDHMAAAAAAPQHVIVICTKETAVGAMATGETAGPVNLPVQCISREFTPAELMGGTDAETGAPCDLASPTCLQPGQALLDERIGFLMDQGLSAEDIPTCTKHFADNHGGTCPLGTPKGDSINPAPNSAGVDALGQLNPAAVAFLRKQSERLRKAGTKAEKKGKKAQAEKKNMKHFGGALLTSGSFTMMAAMGIG